MAESLRSSKIMPIFADVTRLTSPGNARDNMDKVKYEAASYRLQRLIKAIFGDNLIRSRIDNYDDAMMTECVVELFSIISVDVSGSITKDQLAEMLWYGCKLELISATCWHTTDDAASRLYFDCREFSNLFSYANV